MWDFMCTFVNSALRKIIGCNKSVIKWLVVVVCWKSSLIMARLYRWCVIVVLKFMSCVALKSIWSDLNSMEKRASKQPNNNSSFWKSTYFYYCSILFLLLKIWIFDVFIDETASFGRKKNALTFILFLWKKVVNIFFFPFKNASIFDDTCLKRKTYWLNWADFFSLLIHVQQK